MRQRFVIWTYRFGHWVEFRVHVPVLRQSLLLVARALHSLVVTFLHVEIPRQVVIGKRLTLGHGGHGTVMNSSSVLGDDVTVLHLVTLAGSHDARAPRLGNRVYVGCGAVLVGGVVVGDDAVVGANSVVVEDVPAGCTVVGAPARIVSTHRRTLDELNCAAWPSDACDSDVNDDAASRRGDAV